MIRKVRVFIQWTIALVFWVCASAFASGAGQMDGLSEVESGTLFLRFDEVLNKQQTRLKQTNNRQLADERSVAGKQATQGNHSQKSSPRAKASQWVAPQLESEVDIKVTGPIVRVVVSQTFTNPSQYWAEGVYVFPLSENAAVDHMRMVIGERTIEGQIKERGAAKKTYEQAKQSGRRASLVEQERANIFTTSVANIPPGESIKVVIEYQHEAERQGKLYSLRFPMTITPRYAPGTCLPIGDSRGDGGPGYQEPGYQDSKSQGSGYQEPGDHELDQKTLDNEAKFRYSSNQNSQYRQAKARLVHPETRRVMPPWGLQHQNHNPTKVSVSIQPGFEIAKVGSPYHQVDKRQVNANHWQVSLPPEYHHANADFVLEWTARELGVPQVQMFREGYKGSEYALLMISPPIADIDIAPMPRDITYVIDTSGSMGGESIEQAKGALAWAIKRLDGRDRFNIIEFNSGAWRLFSSVEPADRSHKNEALSFIHALEAEGGTEMKPALDLALCPGYESPERLRQVIFLTDGAVTNEQALFKLINKNLGNTRLFTVGIGSAPNSYFMRRAAELGRGTFTYIDKLEEVSEKMQALFASIEAPVLTNLRVQIPGQGHEITPSPIPDLYLGSPLVLALKSKQLPNKIRLVASMSGAPWQVDLDLSEQLAGSVGSEAAQHQGIHVQWARKKIASLLIERALTREESIKDQLKADVLKLALQHHLVSPFTSLVAVDTTPVRPENKQALSHRLKTNAPKGSTFGLPKTATPWRLYNYLALLCFALAMLMAMFQRRAGMDNELVKI